MNGETSYQLGGGELISFVLRLLLPRDNIVTWLAKIKELWDTASQKSPSKLWTPAKK